MNTADDRETAADTNPILGMVEDEAEWVGPGDDGVRLLAVEARGKYRIWLKYADGAEGEVDLSQWARIGVFKVWDEPGVFESVRLDEYGAVQWTDTLDMCPVALYMDVTGKTWEEVYPNAPA